jgi:glycerophosphoryl diester phosphodiesterase
MSSASRADFVVVADTFRRTWRQLVAASVLFKVVALAVLAPLAGLLLRFVVSASGGAAVADEEILFFMLSPAGLFGLLLFAAVTLAIVALQQACLMTVAFADAQDGRRIGARTALFYAMSRATSVLLLTARISGAALLIAAPFLALGGGVYVWFLTEFDINFYLSERPPELWLAGALIGVILLPLSVVLAARAVVWLVSLPTLLFEPVSSRQALRLAAQRVRGHKREGATVLAIWAIVAALLSSVATALVAGFGRAATPWAMGSMSLMLTLAALVMTLWFVSGQTVTFINGAGFALLVIAFYRRVVAADAAAVHRRQELRQLDDARRERWSGGVVVSVPVIALLAGVAVTAIAVNGLSAPSDAQITAHRGAATWAPENTLASVQRALDDGADWVEIDVQESADGRIVVVHDSDFMKLAGVPTKVWEATYDEIRQIDIGSSFSPEFAGQRVPTLEDVLERARGRAGVNIELKYYGHDQRLEQRVVRIVETLGMEEQVVVMSLKYGAVQQMRSLRPEWTLGLLTAVAIGDLTRLDADFLAVNTGLATRALVHDAHAAGKEVFVWTVNDPVTAYAMISRGVDGIITDDPAMGIRVREAYNGLDGLQRLLVGVALMIGAFDLDDEEPAEIG